MSYRTAYMSLIGAGLVILIFTGVFNLLFRPVIEFMFNLNLSNHCSLIDLYYLKCGSGRDVFGVVLGYIFLFGGIALFLFEKSLIILSKLAGK